MHLESGVQEGRGGEGGAGAATGWRQLIACHVSIGAPGGRSGGASFRAA